MVAMYDKYIAKIAYIKNVITRTEANIAGLKEKLTRLEQEKRVLEDERDMLWCGY